MTPDELRAEIDAAYREIDEAVDRKCHGFRSEAASCRLRVGRLTRELAYALNVPEAAVRLEVQRRALFREYREGATGAWRI